MPEFCLVEWGWNDAHHHLRSYLAPHSLVCCVPHSLLPLLCLEGKFFFILEVGIPISRKEERCTGTLSERELVCRSKSNNVYSVKPGELLVTPVILLWLLRIWCVKTEDTSQNRACGVTTPISVAVHSRLALCTESLISLQTSGSSLMVAF